MRCWTREEDTQTYHKYGINTGGYRLIQRDHKVLGLHDAQSLQIGCQKESGSENAQFDSRRSFGLKTYCKKIANGCLRYVAEKHGASIAIQSDVDRFLRTVERHAAARFNQERLR